MWIAQAICQTIASCPATGDPTNQTIPVIGIFAASLGMILAYALKYKGPGGAAAAKKEDDEQEEAVNEAASEASEETASDAVNEPASDASEDAESNDVKESDATDA